MFEPKFSVEDCPHDPGNRVPLWGPDGVPYGQGTTWWCDDCGKQMTGAASVQAARLRALRSQRKCAWCGSEFTNSDELADHIMDGHPKS
ncbi:MAG TPA: hypothetical protein VH187_13615 [Scandinavium sp.]|jgi:hypothetical protein|uniref:hypothetical protein n=1 Tax=Scandinavium sp. TaxID=2830653 RepID=UPI002E326253|nr:hypothetical protein [Scandinavium sp.]HEX4502169.1 hypothetical protein [Scandinavium sp.]